MYPNDPLSKATLSILKAEKESNYLVAFGSWILIERNQIVTENDYQE